MKIECRCGETIHDSGDGLSNKAHVIPDAGLFPLMDALEDLVLKHCQTATQREAACTRLRSLFSKASRQAWQCRACGRLYLDDAAHALHAYAPEEGATKAIFAP